METIPPVVSPEKVEALTASEYRRRYGRTLMVLKKLRGELPEANELCRIASVNTIDPGLWITARFLDGTTRSFRPELIQQNAVQDATLV